MMKWSAMLLMLPVVTQAGEWVATAEGCRFWNGNASANDVISWSGECVDGKVDGQGTIVWTFDTAEGIRATFRYVGQIREGKYEGQGTAYFSNGDRYAGQWRDDKKHGDGVYYHTDGKRQAGYFQNDQLWQGWYHHADGSSCEVQDHQAVDDGCFSWE